MNFLAHLGHGRMRPSGYFATRLTRLRDQGLDFLDLLDGRGVLDLVEIPGETNRIISSLNALNRSASSIARFPMIASACEVSRLPSAPYERAFSRQRNIPAVFTEPTT